MSRIEFIDEKNQKTSEIEKSSSVLLSGPLKSAKGTKLTAYLLDRVFLLTRHVTRDNQSRDQIYRRPFPLRHLLVEFEDVTSSRSGSFRGSLRNSEKGLLLHHFNGI